MDLKPTLSALLVKNDMSFHWDIKLKRWWLVKEKPAGQKWQSKLFEAPNLELAKKAAILYLELLTLDTAPLNREILYPLAPGRSNVPGAYAPVRYRLSGNLYENVHITSCYCTKNVINSKI